MEGDQVLVDVAGILRSSVRAPEYLARYGGEEFVIILPASDLHQTELVAERMRAAVENNTWVHRSITISVGIASATGREGLGALVKRADVALYQAKADERNRIKLAVSI